jgi:LPS export ABC transporter protein LptC
LISANKNSVKLTIRIEIYKGWKYRLKSESYDMIERFLQIFILSAVLVLSCSKIEEDHSTSSLDQARIPDQESWESVIIMTRDGKKFAEVWAGYIAFYNEQGKTFLRDSIHADFFDRKGIHNSVLTADSGVVFNQTNNLVAYGKVKVISDSGVVLETSELRWENEKQKIISEVSVRFSTQIDTLLGDSFISDPDLSNYEIKNARGYSRRVIPLEK